MTIQSPFIRLLNFQLDVPFCLPGADPSVSLWQDMLDALDAHIEAHGPSFITESGEYAGIGMAVVETGLHGETYALQSLDIGWMPYDAPRDQWSYEIARTMITFVPSPPHERQMALLLAVEASRRHRMIVGPPTASAAALLSFPLTTDEAVNAEFQSTVMNAFNPEKAVEFMRYWDEQFSDLSGLRDYLAQVLAIAQEQEQQNAPRTRESEWSRVAPTFDRSSLCAGRTTLQLARLHLEEALTSARAEKDVDAEEMLTSSLGALTLIIDALCEAETPANTEEAST